MEDYRSYLDVYMSSLSTAARAQQGRYAIDFISFAPDLSKESLDKYFARIRAQYADSSVRYIYSIIKRLFTVNNLPWPYHSADTPVVREQSVFAPILDPSVIQEMIQASPKMPARLAFYLAVSTTYGCRRVELASLSREDIDLNKKLIYIATAKAGRQRYHLIPDVIMPVIEHLYYRLEKTNLKTLDRYFHRIEEFVSFPHVKDVGWHSIRRALDRQLLETGLPEFLVADFLRWKRSERNMPLRYARGTVINRESATRESIAISDRVTDERVFAVHPFLPYWSQLPYRAEAEKVK